MRLCLGFGGWVAFDGLGLPGPLYVRFRDVDGRLRIAELYLDASESEASVEAADVSSIPIRRIEAAANQFGDDVRHGAQVTGPDLSTLASYFSTSFGRTVEQVTEGNWVVASFVAQKLKEGQRGTLHPEPDGWVIETGADRRPNEGPGVMRVRRQRQQWKGVRELDAEFRLSQGPPKAGLTAEFLSDVARAYAAAVARGERPNKALAEQTNYPLKTAQRWVYTARERGLMPPGKKGAAG